MVEDEDGIRMMVEAQKTTPLSCVSDVCEAEEEEGEGEEEESGDRMEEVVSRAICGGEGCDRRRNGVVKAVTSRSRHGVVSIIGRRREMEDAVAVQKKFLNSLIDKNGCVLEYDFFAVFDGHGGANVARFCRERMHLVVAEEVMRNGDDDGDDVAGAGGGRKGKKGVNWEKVMAGSFGKVDEEVNLGEMATEKMRTIGTTAVVAVVGEEEVVVANCGDSRAVICRNGVAVPLSSDHKVYKLYNVMEFELFEHWRENGRVFGIDFVFEIFVV